MIAIENYIGFIIAGIILNITPGADTIYILTRSIAQGKKAGIYSVLGIVSGAFIHCILAGLGLSVIITQSIILFNIIKWTGAIYLVYLGIMTLKSQSNLFDEESKSLKKTSLAKIYKQGFLTNLFNPKVALFFLSLLPQFIKPEYTDNVLPFLILGGTFITTGTIWCLFLVYASSLMTQTLRNNNRISKLLQKVSGMVFIGLGLKLLTNKS